MNVRRTVNATLAAVVVGAATACDTANVGTKPEPANVGDELAILRRIVDERALTRDDFYTQAELSRRFGRMADIKIAEMQGADRGATAVVHPDFADLPPRPPLPSGIYMDFHKYRQASGPHAGAMICYLNASFVGFSAGMDFDSVVARLGPGWRRDTAAENEKFMAVTREPFNPPFRSATAPMGNAVIVYGKGDREIALEFTPAGMLGSMTKTRVPC